MIKKSGLLIIVLLIFYCAPAQINIIPQPAEVTLPKSAGNYSINADTKIVCSGEELQNCASFLKDYLQRFYTLHLNTGDGRSKENTIYLNIQKNGNPAGSYKLYIKKKGIYIEGNDAPGVFYGVQSLLQLLPADKANGLSVPYVQVTDRPRFAYRGMHLDVCRHFFTVSFVKQYIDFLALHKMNYFHWHLTDDQGWRIEIKKYPKLTEVGGYRDGTIVGHYPGTSNDNTRYGGYYTQEEIKEVVAYAAKRYITVIPEIEMPGHSSAAIAAYPWLSCFPEKETKIPEHPSTGSQQKTGKKVQETWGVFDDIFCAGKDSTFTFLQDVLDEVMTLFPSSYIHVGGDEAPKNNWKICPRCQERIKKEGLKDEHQLQSYFIHRMEKYLNAKGRTLIGWDEILEGGLAPNAIVMSWRGEDGGIAAAKQQHQVIMTPGNYVYFDHSQVKNDDSLTIGGFTTVEKVYSYEPIPKQLDSAQGKYIMGAQANVWTEYIGNDNKVEYMIFPRMSALSEVLWSPKELRDWKTFAPRLKEQCKRYDLWKVNYYKPSL